MLELVEVRTSKGLITAATSRGQCSLGLTNRGFHRQLQFHPIAFVSWPFYLQCTARIAVFIAKPGLRVISCTRPYFVFPTANRLYVRKCIRGARKIHAPPWTTFLVRLSRRDCARDSELFLHRWITKAAYIRGRTFQSGQFSLLLETNKFRGSITGVRLICESERTSLVGSQTFFSDPTNAAATLFQSLLPAPRLIRRRSQLDLFPGKIAFP